PLHADRRETLLHLVELVRLDDRVDPLHTRESKIPTSCNGRFHPPRPSAAAVTAAPSGIGLLESAAPPGWTATRRVLEAVHADAGPAPHAHRVDGRRRRPRRRARVGALPRPPGARADLRERAARDRLQPARPADRAPERAPGGDPRPPLARH